uniref:NADH dehydrogenase subunit 4L n=1 Tax=Thyreophagus entomophagus TaxID=2874286 RepID=A0A977KE11_9ACAR|nr:NADH dehydrogenase subunit 4L [Thyreophagus entomophagus]UXD78888.1 NADH dehydrogenase subunit 4L [Thyreophagus entomophagus]
MSFFFLFTVLGFYVFFFSSLHSLTFLLFIEILVIVFLFVLFIFGYSWLFPVMFLLFSVCLGAYGVSVYVALSRSCGSSYFVSF